jgi:hypothetical protein
VEVLAQIIAERDGARESAAQAWQQALTDADHLAVLHGMWTAETTPAHQRRYRSLLQSALPPGTGQQPSHQEQWLHRTLRAAELAGLDPAEVLARAVAERDLLGARDAAAVIDARIRRRHGDLVPLPATAWSSQVPETDDPERRRFLTQLAAAMDDRRRRIGEHAAASSLPWAVAALGAVPDNPDERLAWQQKAAAIGAYRELSGHSSPDDPIGPEPTANSPDLRAAWQSARAALTRDDVRHSRESWLPGLAETSRRIEELAARHHELAARMTGRQSLPVPAEGPGSPGTSPAFPLAAAHSRTAILQPPRPEIPVSPWILERLADRDLDHEAGG